MKAAVLRRIGQPLAVEEVPRPEPLPGEALVRTVACGICATDLHISAGWAYEPKLPFIMGHEPAGIVEALGEDVIGFEPGDRVVPNIFYTCGNCYYCRTNNETLCSSLRGILGVLTYPGAYAEYFTIPARQLFHLPENVPFTEGAIIADAVVSAAHAVSRRAEVKPGQTVLVLGMGGVGLSALQAARAAGGRVIAVDIDEGKLAEAAKAGAMAQLRGDLENVPERVRDLTGGSGAQVAVDCWGSETTLSQAVESLAAGGRLVIVGYTRDKYALSPQLTSRKELEIYGSRSGGRQDTVEAIRLVASGNWVPIVKHEFPLEEANEALELLRSGRALGRIVLRVASDGTQG